MSAESVLNEVTDTVKRTVPENVEITEIEFEGSVVVIYTKNLDEFADNTEIVRKLAQQLRRRVDVRPDPSLLAELGTAEEFIKEIVPKDAEITNIYFEHDTGEVTIEALAPGIAIGKHGVILNEIKKTIGWAPKVVRTPPIPSKTVGEIREYLRSVHEERKEFLINVGHRLNRAENKGESWIRTTSLGGYRQVGRSATLLSTRDSKILVDCGVDFSSEEASNPFLNAPEVQPLENLDGVVLTHAHLDHCGLVPALFRYGYNGPVYCTPPTRDLMTLLLLDYIKVSFGEAKKAPYDSSNIKEVVKHVIPLRYGETTDIAPDIRLTFHNAGHILGSAIGHFHIGDGLYNIAITGDIKFEKTWLFNQAVNKFPRLETLIMESTYGGHKDNQPSRKDAAEQLKSVVQRTIARQGKILVPVFAVGRSQEVMMVVETLMRYGEIPTLPIYLDGMIWEATAIHTAHPEYLNSQLRTQIFQKGENPFLSEIFRRVDSQEMRENIINDTEPCIVLATSGMMNGGPVMEYFKTWASESNNSIIFVGYQAEGTTGRRIQRGLNQMIMSDKGQQITVNIKLNIETCEGFSGHSDRKQLLSYVGSMDPKPERIIIGHGEESKCIELASTLHKRYGVETRVPYNLETIRAR